MNIILWNDKVKLDAKLVGKCVLLNRFKLHDYNGSLSLNSSFRSSIQAVNEHIYQQF
jgi:hypothetical protein